MAVHIEKEVTRSPAIAEGPRDAGVPVEILPAVERLYTIRLTNTDRVSVSASRLTLKSIHIAATEVNCTDKL